MCKDSLHMQMSVNRAPPPLGGILNNVLDYGRELSVLELQHRLIRRTINIAVSKALEDMKSNTKPQHRNLMIGPVIFQQVENQECFLMPPKRSCQSKESL
jgi:hypothetical protein